ncbi:MAG TPA: hypothetical protein VEQ18_02995 [Candidatus Nitrosocosmicus sp.]|nr:hypothetical protein [Candidatus Nitrosocosmicus sp.]
MIKSNGIKATSASMWAPKDIPKMPMHPMDQRFFKKGQNPSFTPWVKGGNEIKGSITHHLPCAANHMSTPPTTTSTTTSALASSQLAGKGLNRQPPRLKTINLLNGLVSNSNWIWELIST